MSELKIIAEDLNGVKLIEPVVFNDKRGFFMESYNKKKYEALGLNSDFVQDNISYSKKNVLRGLHYQYQDSQAKLVYVLQGEILDVALDIRVGSPTFGKYKTYTLSSQNKRQVYIPRGFAHGFCVLSEEVLFCYKCDDFYNPKSENGVLWSDPDLKIDWKTSAPIVSDRDKELKCLKEISKIELPKYEDSSNR